MGAHAITLVAILVPLLGVVAVPFLVWGWGFRVTDLVVLLVGYVVTTLGITVGFHRYFTHRSFETGPVIQFLLAVLGSMAVQGSLFRWVAIHRIHHHYSDQAQDPHTPNQGTGRGWAVVKGFWHAHIGWFFDPAPADLERTIKDLTKVRALRIASAWWVGWVVLGLLVPAGIGLLCTHRWSGFLTGLIWGGVVRVFLVHHLTWSINSACHLWGRRTYRSGDLSRNNLPFGYLGLGEGWHNTHHAFPTSARHGLRWWQLDASYGVIRALAGLGLAWNVHVPSREARLRKELGRRGAVNPAGAPL